MAVLGGGLAVACGGAAGQPRTGGTGTAKPGAVLGALADIPAGGGRLVDVEGGGQLLVVRSKADEVRAFDPRCPHTGSLVSPPSGGEISCPTHGSRFDPTTGELRRGPATSGLAAVPVRLDSGKILLG